jgi:hypothetical protein
MMDACVYRLHYKLNMLPLDIVFLDNVEEQ